MKPKPPSYKKLYQTSLLFLTLLWGSQLTAQNLENIGRGKTETADGVLNNLGLKHEMAQTLGELRSRGFTESTVDIGVKFKPESTTSKMSDIRYGDLDIELKNKDFPSADAPNGRLSNQEVEQVLGNEGAFSVKTKLSDYQWKVNPLRNNADAANLRKLWKKAFQNTDATKGPTQEQIFETIWGNASLREDLFDLSETATKTPAKQFEYLVSNTSSDLYKFIKSE